MRLKDKDETWKSGRKSIDIKFSKKEKRKKNDIVRNTKNSVEFSPFEFSIPIYLNK